MKLKIAAYGIARDILGNHQIEYSLDHPISSGDLLKKLQEEYPDFQRLTSLLVAVNSEYAKPEQMINENDEVVLIPPVSGG